MTCSWIAPIQHFSRWRNGRQIWETRNKSKRKRKAKDTATLPHIALSSTSKNWMYAVDMLIEYSSSRAIQDSQGLPCNCSQWFAKILASLKALMREEPSLQRMESVLVCTQGTIDVWKRLLQYGQCRANNAEEVLYLSISGVRIAMHNLDTNFSLNDIDGDGALPQWMAGKISTR